MIVVDYKKNTAQLKHEYAILLNRLAALCSRSEKCEYDAMEYMLSHGASEDDAASAVEYLTANHFIDNARYAYAFAADKSRFAKWGAHKIAAALRLKRIPASIIADALDNAVDPKREKQTVLDEMAKKLRGIKADEPKQKLWQKLMRFGIARGYSVEVCKEAISRLLADA